MKDLIILGAGGAAYNLVEFVEDINEVNPTWNLLGFLDDNISLIGNIIHGYKVLGNINESKNYEKAYFTVYCRTSYFRSDNSLRRHSPRRRYRRRNSVYRA